MTIPVELVNGPARKNKKEFSFSDEYAPEDFHDRLFELYQRLYTSTRDAAHALAALQEEPDAFP